MADDQIRLDYATPQPGSRRSTRQVIFLTGGFVLLALFIASVLLSSFNPPRVESNRVKCSSNLRQIGQAMLLYANDSGGKYPDHIEDLLVEEITPDVFVCPNSNDTYAAVGPTTQATQANLIAPGHCSYIYCGKGFTSSASANTIFAYEPLGNHKDEGNGSNVLFGDGHVEFVEKKLMTKILAELAAGQNPPRAEKLR